MAYRIVVFEKSGRPIAELEAEVHCSWRLNAAGKAELSISTSDKKAKERFLRFGNYILVDHSTLGRWVGFIWTPLKWGDGAINVIALSAEALFTRRITKRRGSWNGSANGLYRRLISRAQKHGDFLLREGAVSGSSKSYHIDHRLQKLSSLIDDLQRKSDEDWWVSGSYDDDASLQLDCNWTARRGKTRKMPLIEGKNLQLASMASEAGLLANHWVVEGEEQHTSLWPVRSWHDQRSIDLYGRTDGVEFTDMDTSKDVLKRAKELVDEHAFPYMIIRALVTPDAFKALRVGDVVPISLDSVGFFQGAIGTQLSVRIRAIEYKSADEAALITFEKEEEYTEQE